jgi:hypothetical protein
MGVARRKPVSADDLGSVDSLRRKESVMTVELIAHLESADEPLLVRRTGVLVWGDEERHAAGYVRDPCGYALLALAPGVRTWQRARILLQLLSVSWASLDPQLRATLSRVVRVLVLGLPASHVATVLLALRHRRANHKHVTRAALRLLAEHPQAEELMRTHRRVLLAVVEHALGKATARGAARALIEGGVAEQGPGPDLHRRLLRLAPDGAVAMARIRALYQGPASLDQGTASPHQGQAAPALAVPELVDLDLGVARPGTVTATNRGDVAATLVHLYRGGPAADLESALDGYVETAAARVASYPGTLAFVLDRSASMRGYGDREWALYSQAVALRMVLQRRCTKLVEVPVGGDGDRPGGATDLAAGVLDAVAHGPDLVAVVSDGYENVYPGDLARVVATLPRVGIATPVVFCHSTFGHSDDLALRRAAPGLPQRAFWHEEDFAPLMLWLLAHSSSTNAEGALKDALMQRLAAVERRLA